MLFQVESKGTQSHIHMYPFSFSFYPGKMRTQKIPLQQSLWSCTFNLGTFLITSKDAQNRVKEVNSTHHHQMAFLGWKEFQNWKLPSFQHGFKSKHLGKNALTRISLNHENKYIIWPWLLFSDMKKKNESHYFSPSSPAKVKQVGWLKVVRIKSLNLSSHK